MSDDRIEMAAAAWAARADRGLTPAEQEALAQWLGQSVLHKVAYLRLKAAWQRADRLAALKRPLPHAGPAARFGMGTLAAAVLLLAALLGGGYFALRVAPRPPVPPAQLYATQIYATKLGRLLTVRLQDGSRMELNTNTRVHAKVTGTSRTVTLESGEAYFDVVHDPKRPFTVYAGNRRITDLGTRFSVYRNGEDVQVTVQEGRVKVDTLNPRTVAAPVEAGAGSIVLARTEETLVLAKPQQQIESDLSWRRGMLVFNRQTLAEAAEQFNRYNAKQIVVEGKARKIRIGGSFKADNVAGFIYLIHEGFGVSVRDRGNSIFVSL